MKLLEPGTEVDGFVVHECIHAGGMAHIYHAGYANTARDPGFPLAMKIPRMTAPPISSTRLRRSCGRTGSAGDGAPIG